MQLLLQEKDELEQFLFPVTICMNKTFLTLAPPLTALKIILIYVQSCEKRKPKHVYMDWCEIRIEKLIFINLDR